MSMEAVNGLLGPEFYFRVKCMNDMLAMRQGVDPDKPSTNTSDSNPKTGTRKVKGAEALSVLAELSALKEKAKLKDG